MMTSECHVSKAPPLAPEPYAAGCVIRRKYRLERMLAEGGMGEVWVAHNRALDAPVALKLIRGELRDAVASERLLREARAAAKLRHPSIVRVFDFGVTEQRDPYIVMELLEGQSLRDVLCEKGAMPAPRAVQILLPVIHALSAAHAAGIVHRDLKPENVVLCHGPDGTVDPKVVDFGIAKRIRPAGSTYATAVGLVGTPSYMSPEQILELDGIDARADVWACCVVLYELVSDAMPFEGATHEEVFEAALHRPAPPLAGRKVDEALREIVARGLEKDREARWGSMRELGRALAGWLVDRGIDEDATGASLRVRWLDRLSGAAERPFDAEVGGLSREASPPPPAPCSPSPRIPTGALSSSVDLDFRPRSAHRRAMTLSAAGLAATAFVCALGAAGAAGARNLTGEASSAALTLRARTLGASALERQVETELPRMRVEETEASHTTQSSATSSRRHLRRPLRPEEVDFGF